VHGFAIPPKIDMPPADGGVSGLSMKPICAARQTQSAIAAFRQMLQQGVAAGDIAAIEVAVPPKFTGLIDHARIGARMGRITSIGYLLALAAYRPEALGEVARAETMTDEAFRALAACVSVVGDAALEQHYPAHWPARVTLRLVSGRCLSETVIAAPGDPERRLEGAALVEKFHSLARTRVGAPTAERLQAAALAATIDDAALAALSSLTAAF
jgi:2-methylcitrate dehydratase PrpD